MLVGWWEGLFPYFSVEFLVIKLNSHLASLRCCSHVMMLFFSEEWSMLLFVNTWCQRFKKMVEEGRTYQLENVLVGFNEGTYKLLPQKYKLNMMGNSISTKVNASKIPRNVWFYILQRDFTYRLTLLRLIRFTSAR